ncbi:hypothetical protein QWI17_02415 [Gilvimarinus sp. SDUM040013]|uniref:Short NACHT-associated C-terminal domain-containing protein n=1 Tax=Gilvimarinus gilvus TaxID=3058038 RepID=A0ABU4RZE6_9GAMM|nr:hypothetical protein [Gilvimarinus sp. SDUM040013]MDO3384686.1 hypothetical protein [Gilvimarinus sp. SDUM040013]MDX6850272.1 hypothetical protein [Gilvimarinus sp. SDUM040013]
MDSFDANYSDLVHWAVRHHEGYKFPHQEYFKKHLEDMYEKYGSTEEEVGYETKKMTYRTPIMVDTLKSKGAFSLEYIQAGFDAYKHFQEKHENNSKNIELLLGIGS